MQITRSYAVKNLGVIFDETWLLRSTKSKMFRDTNVIKVLYYNFVMSRLEYAYVALSETISSFCSLKVMVLPLERKEDYIAFLRRHGFVFLTCRHNQCTANFIRSLFCDKVECHEILSSVNRCSWFLFWQNLFLYAYSKDECF